MFSRTENVIHQQIIAFNQTSRFRTRELRHLIVAEGDKDNSLG